MCIRFLRAIASIASSIARISYGISVSLSVCLSQTGTVLRSGEIETSGFHRMIA